MQNGKNKFKELPKVHKAALICPLCQRWVGGYIHYSDKKYPVVLWIACSWFVGTNPISLISLE